ncbi:hypothetical protein Zmor_008530 [Zophobas morio]|uniref:Uncharacterized protein n=1 Tax=Zophobas morio TaxID=2755281 RepID=A0AA38IYW9_9CUCU|nr:hypothetical protein Zmor_008530 [Zophobas morio]
MSALSTENLFLLEFLVDDLKLNARCDCMNPSGVCVCFQFLDNDPLDVCEEDFNGGNKFGEESVKTGKSCLFSLTPEQTKQVLKSFDITVGVFKRMPSGSEPEKACMGAAKVPILDLFMELISSKEVTTCAKVLQDNYPLLDTNKTPIGKIGVYIRLSCYGKNIVTQFQMNMDDKSVLFKDKEGRSLYRYKKSKKGRATKIEDLSCKDNPQAPCYQPPQCPEQTYGQQFPPPNYNCPQQPCFPPGMMGPGMMDMMGGPNMMGGGGMFPPPNMNFQTPPCFPPPNPNCPNQPCFPPPNPNCPNQPCFPPSQDECPLPGRPSQQVSFAAAPSGRGGCSGGCGRMC